MIKILILLHFLTLYTLPIIGAFWLFFFFTKRYKPLLITSVLLLILDLDFILNLPQYLSDPFPNLIQPFRYIYDEIFAFLVGLWGILQTLPIILKGDSVVDSWSMIVEQGAGHDQRLLDTTQEYIKESRMPNVDCYQEYVANALFGTKRNCLIVAHRMYRDYKMYITARNFGAHLDVSWFLAVQPGFLKRTLSKYSTGNPQALSQQIDMFDQQDIRAFVTIAHHLLKRAIDILLEELKQDPMPLGLSASSKGFLNVW
jgi:hypothetical protein